jgi:hypothetical protein
MERVSDVYRRPYNAENPAVCMDGSPEQLIECVRKTEIKVGRKAREDYEYIRHGAANIFMANGPLKGKRPVEVTMLKTMPDRAKFMAGVANEMYPDAQKNNFGNGQLFNTHDGCIYEGLQLVLIISLLYDNMRKQDELPSIFFKNSFIRPEAFAGFSRSYHFPDVRKMVTDFFAGLFRPNPGTWHPETDTSILQRNQKAPSQ